MDDAMIKTLRATTKRRIVAEERATELRDATHALILQGYREGVSKRALAREAGLTRATVYSILHRNGCA